MFIDPIMLATMTGIVGACLAAVWSFCMARYVAAPRAKVLFIEALSDPDGPECKLVRQNLVMPAVAPIQAQMASLVERIPRTETIVSEVQAKLPSAETIADMIEIPEVTVDLDPAVNAIVERMQMWMKGEQANAVKSFTKAYAKDMESVDDMREAMTEAMKAEYLAGNPAAQYAANFMQDHLSKGFRKENPQWAFAYDSLKSALAPFVIGQASSLPGSEGIGMRPSGPTGKGTIGVR